MQKLITKRPRNQLFCFLAKNELRFTASFFLKLFQRITVLAKKKINFLRINFKKLFRFLRENQIVRKSFEFSETQNLTSNINQNQLFRFLPKKCISFAISFFLKFFKQTYEIDKNRIIFFGNDIKKLFRFFKKNQISQKSFEFLETSKTISENCKNQNNRFSSKKRIVFDVSFFLKLFQLIKKSNINRVFFFEINTGKLN